MKYTNILEKMDCIFNLVKDNWIYIAFLSFAGIMLLLANFKKISRKTCFITNLISYITLLSYSIATHSKQLGKIGNSLIDNLFMNIYFPSAYAYLFVLITMNIVTLVSMLNRKLNKVYKWIHGIFFFAIQFIFILILELLSTNKIDIFSKTSLFSNKDIIMLLEFSINLFIAWMIILTFVYFTNIITEKISLSSITEKQKKTIPVTINTLTADINLAENVQPEEVQVPTTVIEQTVPVVNVPIAVEQVLPVTNVPVIENNNNTVEINSIEEQPTESFLNTTDFIPTQPEKTILEPVITNEEYTSTIEQTKEHNSETDNYTLNDYRLFNQILKDIKNHNQSNTVTIDKNLEYRIITKYSTETYDMFKKMLKIYSH